MNSKLILWLLPMALLLSSISPALAGQSETWREVTVYYKNQTSRPAQLKMKNYYENKVPIKVNGDLTRVDIDEIDSIKGQDFSYHTMRTYRPRKSGQHKQIGVFMMPVLCHSGDLTIYHTLEGQYSEASQSPQVSHRFYLSGGDDDQASFMVMTISPADQMPISSTEQSFAYLVRRYVEAEFADRCPQLGADFEQYIQQHRGADLFQGLMKLYQQTCR